jgi:hypothetical protein
MSTLLSALVSGAHAYTGRGENHEQEAFSGMFVVQPLVGGAAAMLHFTATREDGTRVHSESTLLARAADGSLCLWPVMDELPVVMPHPLISAARDDAAGDSVHVFASGPRSSTEVFRQEITLRLLPGGRLRYAHAWGLPGGEFGDRSHCELVAAMV